jgi:hypothetical protein
MNNRRQVPRAAGPRKGKAGRRAKRPAFGKDFGLAWVGFARGPSLLSAGIAYLTRRDKVGGPCVTHAFLVTGPDECVEANFPAGVVTSRLSESYLDGDGGPVVFRKPRGLTPAVARRLVRRVKAEVGAQFDAAAMAAEGLAGTFVGHLLNSLFKDKPKELAARLTHRKGRWVCSDLVMYCLRGEPRYRGKGVLARPVGTVSPQTLFEDEELFEPLPGEKG